MQYQWARLIHHTSGLLVRQRRGSGFARGVPSPARALAGYTAKRQIVAEAERISQADPLREGDCWRGSNDALQGVLQVMAVPYANHPDYRRERAPRTVPSSIDS